MPRETPTNPGEHRRCKFEVRDLGRLAYGAAYDAQLEAHARVLGWREESERAPEAERPAGALVDSGLPAGVLLVVEHEPVITVTRRAKEAGHVLADATLLSRLGVTLADTDRGGDVTYHGPGQLVVYPIVDLNRLGLGLHAYMRALEQGVIDALATFDVPAQRDEGPEPATGVWVDTRAVRGERVGVVPTPEDAIARRAGLAKIAAMGVRVRRWVTLHGLALNVAPDLTHFGLIVPCGLHGRPVTSLRALLGERAPALPDVARAVTSALQRTLSAAADKAAPGAAGA